MASSSSSSSLPLVVTELQMPAAGADQLRVRRTTANTTATTTTTTTTAPPAQLQSPLAPDLADQGLILVGDHPDQLLGAYYNVDKAIVDIRHAKENSRHFSVSVYLLAALGLVLRLFAFFAALFAGGLALAELMILALWVEPLVVVFVWSRHLALLFAAFWIVMVSFLAKAVYLGLWVWLYWQFVDTVWWWVIASVVGAYAIVAFALLFSVANVIKAKLAFCVVVNDSESLARRRQRPPPPKASGQQDRA